jgi:2-polyprenyl-3-methyl-5-hydroxy-6-metoxy-1,4-benzoquinol methylase
LIQTQGPAAADLFDANYFINNYLFQADIRVQHFQAMLQQAAIVINEPLVDVGAGVGFFLQALPVEMRASAAAVEPASFARERLQEEHLASVIAPTVTELPATVGPFATATLWDVLAGVPEPLALLTAIRQRLAPTGQLIIKTPHHPLRLFQVARCLGWIHKGRALVHVPAQWFHFSPIALTRMLDQAGFTVTKMTWTSEPPLVYPRLSRRLKEKALQGLLRLGTPHASILCVAQRRP